MDKEGPKALLFSEMRGFVNEMEKVYDRDDYGGGGLHELDADGARDRGNRDRG
jgi:hypothetical protein